MPATAIQKKLLSKMPLIATRGGRSESVGAMISNYSRYGDSKVGKLCEDMEEVLYPVKDGCSFNQVVTALTTHLAMIISTREDPHSCAEKIVPVLKAWVSEFWEDSQARKVQTKIGLS
jgi:hypothetical protein